jgi:hypothetical protein
MYYGQSQGDYTDQDTTSKDNLTDYEEITGVISICTSSYTK